MSCATHSAEVRDGTAVRPEQILRSGSANAHSSLTDALSEPAQSIGDPAE
jgi:hypothetical protein